MDRFLVKIICMNCFFNPVLLKILKENINFKSIIKMKRSEDLQDYLKIYKNGLLDDTLPFWINNCIDQKYGGFTFCLGRDGTVIDSDKGIWTHGRFVWLLATL